MTEDKMHDIIERTVTRRVEKIANLLFLKLAVGSISEKIWIAGNSLNEGDVHDVDVFFPLYGHGIGEWSEQPIVLDKLYQCIDAFNNDFKEKMGEAKVLYESKNATTVEFGGTKYQFCMYQKDSATDLVESFDFSHIQIAAEIDFEEDGEENQPQISDVVYTDDYVEAKITGQSKYTGTDYPLGSVFRAEKYMRYGQLTRSEYKKSVVKALTDVIRRGYKDYNDFKDSIGAIDLLLFEKDTSNALFNYFTACAGRGMVDSIQSGTEQLKNETQFSYYMSKDDDETEDGDERDIIEEMEMQSPSDDNKPSLNFDDMFQRDHNDASES